MMCATRTGFITLEHLWQSDPGCPEGQPLEDWESEGVDLANGWTASLVFSIEGQNCWMIVFRRGDERRELDPFSSDMPEVSDQFGSPETWPLVNLFPCSK